MDGVQVYEARMRMGDCLAKKILSVFPDHDIDTVIPIPETSRTSALECATILNVPYREGFVKNRYIARTFIMPGQETRRKTVRLKLNTIKSEFKNKVVLLVDDSIVRGTTAMEIVQMAREAGARKVYFASAAPPVRYSNVYGIDISTRSELIAHNRSIEEITEELGADRIIFNDLEDVEEAVRSLNPSLKSFESSCFSGTYVTEEVTEEYLLNLEASRGLGRMGSIRTPSPSLSTSYINGATRSENTSVPFGNNYQLTSEEMKRTLDATNSPFTTMQIDEITRRSSPPLPGKAAFSGACESIHNSTKSTNSF